MVRVLILRTDLAQMKGKIMKTDKRFRHELKYEVTYMQYMCIRQRLKYLCRPDPHTDENGTYHIRSIYFDNMDDLALSEKILGKAHREKFRIRYYNDDLGFISLEKKQKIGNLCKKVECPLTKDELCDILSGDTSFMKDHPQPLVKELYADMITLGLRPKVLVSYRREPYIYAAGNVRITFDSRIRTSAFTNDFTKDLHDIPATDDSRMMIMEVKYDDLLPDVIREAVNEGNILQQSFSKYEACRRYG